MIRLAAIADIHARLGGEQELIDRFDPIQAGADVLVIAGDLTDTGMEEEARLLGSVLDQVRMPVVGILGNHDHNLGQQVAIRRAVEEHGMVILDGSGWVYERDGVTLGLAGTIGFGGGFRPHNLEAFGEGAWKQLYSKVIEEARKLDRGLAEVEGSDYIVAVTHYSPTRDTMGDEPQELYPYLGSSELGDTLDRYPVLFAIHGHAHRGRLEGCTDNGVAVFNVAAPIVQRPLVWRFDERAKQVEPRDLVVASDGATT